jgi:hypothetical protein
MICERRCALAEMRLCLHAGNTASERGMIDIYCASSATLLNPFLALIYVSQLTLRVYLTPILTMSFGFSIGDLDSWRY